MDQLNHRKATARLRILNPDGTPAAGRSVRIDQVSHQFLFGCGAFDAVELMRTKDEQKKAFLQERMEKWLALFNYGTLPFYWGRYEPVEGMTAYNETMAAARWLREKGVQVKGHPLFQRGNPPPPAGADPPGRDRLPGRDRPVGRDQRSGDHAGIRQI